MSRKISRQVMVRSHGSACFQSPSLPGEGGNGGVLRGYWRRGRLKRCSLRFRADVSTTGEGGNHTSILGPCVDLRGEM